MRLAPWSKEPESYHVVALFTGTPRELSGFLQVWIRWGGHLNLLALKLDPTKLPIIYKNAQAAEAYVIPIDRLPSYELIHWWLERPKQWKLFYLPLKKPVGGGLAERPDTPVGECLAWGYCREAEQQAMLNGNLSTPPSLFWETGERLNLPQARQEYQSIFEQLKPLFFEPPGQPLQQATLGHTPSENRPNLFSLRLEPAQAHRMPTNPSAELKRVRQRIAELREQEAILEWQTGERELAVELAIYRETPEQKWGIGTNWDLRDWLVTAPIDSIQQFQHARIEVNSLGPLHLVRPAKFDRVLTARLPPPAYRLSLDTHWWRRPQQRKVFVPNKLELLPKPPLGNEHVADLLEKALWEGAERTQTTLVLLKTPNGEQHRFIVPDKLFDSLFSHLQELNHQVVLDMRARDPIQDVVEGMLQQVRLVLERILDVHASAMRKKLNEIWNVERVDLNQLQDDVAEAIRVQDQVRNWIEEIQHLRTSKRQVLRQDWGHWAKFLQQLLDLDRGLLPKSRAEVAEWLSTLDQMRANLSSLWEKPNAPHARQATAQQLRKLADQLNLP